MHTYIHRLLTASFFLPSLLFSAPPAEKKKRENSWAKSITSPRPPYRKRKRERHRLAGFLIDSFHFLCQSPSFLFSLYFYPPPLLTGQFVFRLSWSRSSSPSWLTPSRRSPIPEKAPSFICYVSIPTSHSLSPLLPLPPMIPSPSICASPPSPSCAPLSSPPGPRISTSSAAKSWSVTPTKPRSAAFCSSSARPRISPNAGSSRRPATQSVRSLALIFPISGRSFSRLCSRSSMTPPAPPVPCTVP